MTHTAEKEKAIKLTRTEVAAFKAPKNRFSQLKESVGSGERQSLSPCLLIWQVTRDVRCLSITLATSIEKEGSDVDEAANKQSNEY